jgi:predicted DCC family thiol-disulfide oxidoreductase YuxK
MAMLKDHTIIYDDECPMCREYTKGFVKAGMLDLNGRAAYTEVVACPIPNIDWNRARNEIALVNKQNGTVQYGVDSMITVVAHDRKWLTQLLTANPVYFTLKKLYSFISYNRKVIAPGKVFEGENSCHPDFNLRYRVLYIVATWLLTSIVLMAYARHLFPYIPETNFLREFIICGGQVLFQGVFVSLIRKDRTLHYLGNMMTVSMLGALVLIPMLLLQTFIQSPLAYLGYFFLVVCLMLVDHARRVKRLGLPWLLSATWVMYRLIVLYTILK